MFDGKLNSDGTVTKKTGDFFLSSQLFHSIQRINSTTNAITTFTGRGGTGATNGNAQTASFDGPGSMTIDNDGNVFVVDFNNQMVRKISPTGLVESIVGSNTSIATLTRPNFHPISVLVDQSNRLLIADAFSKEILRFENNQLTLLTTVAQGKNLTSMAIDTNGYIFASFETGIVKITEQGTVTLYVGNTVAGNSDGDGTRASFRQIFKLTNHLENLVLTDDAKIRIVFSNSTVSTLAGQDFRGSQDGPGASSSFGSLKGLCVDEKGNIFVIDDDFVKIKLISFN